MIVMQRIFSAIARVLGKRVLVMGLVSLLSLSSLLIFANQPALALSDKPLNSPARSEEAIDRAYTLSHGTGLREEDRQKAYSEEAKAITDPKGLDKIYEEDLKQYKESQPSEGIVEGAKDLVNKVTGKD
jgi:hypothetical protein